MLTERHARRQSSGAHRDDELPRSRLIFTPWELVAASRKRVQPADDETGQQARDRAP